jgi:hypothetical protein
MLFGTLNWWIYANHFSPKPDMNSLAEAQCIKSHGVPIVDEEQQMIDCKLYIVPTPVFTENVSPTPTIAPIVIKPTQIPIRASSTSANNPTISQ